MKLSDEMKANLETLKAEAQNAITNGNAIEAQEKVDAVKDMKKRIAMQEAIEHEAKEAVKDNEPISKQKVAKSNATWIRAAIKKMTGKQLDDVENSLLLPTSTSTHGEKGEGYILPQDIRTIITKKIRQYKSFRDVVGYIPASALTGSFPVENFETVTGLTDFADGTDGTDSTDISFTNVSFSLKEKAAFIKLSNTLLALTDNALISYISDVFAKKAVVTENAMAVTALEKDKTKKVLADWKALKSSLNKDLDPAALYGTVIVTNQDGFDYLDSALDTTGRPILQPNPADATQKMFNGFPVVVFSNTLLPSATKAGTSKNETRAPLYYGNLNEAVKFVDLEGQISFATSTEAGFMSNVTIARLIEFVDCIQVDASDKCYVCGQMTVATATA